MRSRLALVAVGLAVLVGLFLFLRPRGGSDALTPAPNPTDLGEAPAAPSPVEISIEVADGVVSGPGDAEVRVGDEVVLRVSADVADEVHLHGYDLHADVAPGVPGEIRFTADAPGVFEAELEGAGLRILTLTVVP